MIKYLVRNNKFVGFFIVFTIFCFTNNFTAYSLNPQKIIKAAKVGKKLLGYGVRAGTKRAGSSIKLAKRLGILNKKGWAAHHVIPVDVFANHRVFKKLKYFDIDQVVNGIALPLKRGLKGAAKLPLHRGSHPSYSKAVSKALDKIPRGTSAEVTKSMVRAVIYKFKRQLKNGKTLHSNLGAKW
jgi:hypothetical protein